MIFQIAQNFFHLLENGFNYLFLNAERYNMGNYSIGKCCGSI